MSDDWNTENWEDAIRAVFRRALTDVPFRALALKDPGEAFLQVTGRAAPVKLKFVETLEEHVFVLPKLTHAQGDVSEIDVSRILYHSFRQQSIPPGFAKP